MPLKLEIRVTPGSKKPGWKLSGDLICFATSAPPVDGKANQELIKAVAQLLKIPRSAIEIDRGATSRLKLIAIDADVTREQFYAVIKAFVA